MPYVDNHTLEVGDRVRAVSSLVPSGEFIGTIIAIRQEGRRFNVRPEGEENLREARGSSNRSLIGPVGVVTDVPYGQQDLITIQYEAVIPGGGLSLCRTPPDSVKHATQCQAALLFS